MSARPRRPSSAVRVRTRSGPGVHGCPHCAGTTSALVFGSHFATAMDALFAEAGALMRARRVSLSATDCSRRNCSTPNRSYEEAHGLIERWHGCGSAAVRRDLGSPTPPATNCWTRVQPCSRTFPPPGPLHVNENPAEVAAVAALFEDAEHQGTYDRHELVGDRTVSPTTCTPPTMSWRCLSPRAPRWPIARPAMPRWAVAFSRFAGTSARGPRRPGFRRRGRHWLLPVQEGCRRYFMQQLPARTDCR